jgi:hypothetical protein
MKKNIKTRFLTLLVAFIAFTSCSVDNDPPIVAAQNFPVEVAFENSLVGVPDGTTTVNVPVQISQALNQLAKIDYTVNGTSFSETFSTGTTTLNITVDMTGLNGVASLEILDFKMLYSDAEGFSLSVSDKNTTTIVIGEDLKLNLTWTDGLSDIDAAVWELPVPANPIDLFSAAGGSNVAAGTFVNTTNEDLVLPTNLPDGDYGYVVLPFDIGSSSIALTLEVISATTGVEVFNLTIDNAAAGTFGGGSLLYPSAQQVLEINKTGSTWVVSEI